MDPYLTRIGDITIERVPPRNKEAVNNPLVPPIPPSNDPEEEEEENQIKDDEAVDSEKGLDIPIPDDITVDEMEAEPLLLPPVKSPDGEENIEKEFNEENIGEDLKELDEEKQPEVETPGEVMHEGLEEGEVLPGEFFSSPKEEEMREDTMDDIKQEMEETANEHVDEKSPTTEADDITPDTSEGGTKRKTEDRGSDGEQKHKKKRQRKSSGKEGEDIDSSDSDNSDSGDSKGDKSDKEKDKEDDKKKVDRKLTNLRRNIREVMNESELDEETKAAQRQEMERLRRVQEQQKIIRDLQKQIMLQNKAKGRLLNLPNSSSLLRQCTITTTGGSSGQSSAQSSSSSTSSGSQFRIPSSVLMKLAAAGGEANKKAIEMLTSSKRIQPRPTGAASTLESLGLTSGADDDDDDDIGDMDIGASVSIIPSRRSSVSLKEELVYDTDDEAEEEDDIVGLYSDSEDIITVSPRKDPLPLDRSADVIPSDSKPKGKDVVTISSSSEDDCMILSGGSGEESEPEDTTNSGMHTNDLFNVPDEHGNVLINVGHPSDEPDILLAPQIARVIKPHQVGGLRFLYDNVVESLDRFKNSPGFGCILAHSMGLGKTLQVIAFCDVFLRNTAARTVCCIMPINTLQNWVAEFNLWLPADPQGTPLAASGEVWTRQFPLHVLNDSHKSLSARTKVIREWHRNGGVLLIGYELYRQLSLKHDKMRGRKKKRNMHEIMDIPEDGRNKMLWDEIHEALVKPGPDLVICDEGHRIKNSHASISHALKSIASKRRVVLTGYPLQNNLIEYWCMVDFVRPNYLGSKTEFCNMFERPIQNGQCIDSTPQDIRLMRYRAHVLHSLLEGFVQRRSHAVLQTSLPQKNEYVLLLRMTAFQRKLYDKFMNDVVRTKTVPNPLKAFSVCCKIWNHPDILYYFLKKQEDEDVDLDLEETAAAAAATPGIPGAINPTLTPTKPNGKGRPRLNPAIRKDKLIKPAASINPTQPVKLLEGNKVDTNDTEIPPGTVPPPVPPSTSASQVPSQASMYPSFPDNYSNNQYYEQPPYSEQYPSQTSSSSSQQQQQPYQNYYPSQNYSQNNPSGQYYPDQYNNTTNPAQSGYYPQQGSQNNYNNQPYWSSNTYNQTDGQTNYNNSQQQTSTTSTTTTQQNQNNYQQQSNPQQQEQQQQSSSNNYYPNSSNNYPNLMKSNTEQTFPLPARVPNENTNNYSNNFPQQQQQQQQTPTYPFPNAQQNNTTENSFTTFNPLSETAVEENKVNEIKPDVVDTTKEEVKVEEKKEVEDEVVKTTENEIPIDTNVVEKIEVPQKSRIDNLTDVINEVARKPLEPGEIDIPRVPKSMLEMGTNAYRANREEPSIPYDWALELLKGYEPGHLENCAKMEVFFCILEESMALGDRILLFSQSLFTLNLIEDFLQKNNLPGTEERWARNVNYYRLDGSTSALDREKLINEYNLNPKIHLFLVSTRAGSLGINLVGANRVIVFDASWNPCHDTQAVCRVYRYGQRKPCFVYRLVMDKCLEKKIYDRQINKQGMADRVVDELNPDAHLSIREVSNLLYDSEPDTEPQDYSGSKDKYIDIVMQKVLDKLSGSLSKEPFQHESLLVDRKEKKLSQAERRLAKRNYELEKQATLQPRYSNYSMGPQGTIGVGANAPGNSAAGLQIRPVRVEGAKPIASVRPMQAEPTRGPSAPGRGRWIPAEVWQRQGMSAQEMTLPLDVVIPTNSPDRASIVLKAGQRVMVLKSPKGIYMQLENGKIIAIRTALKVGETRKPGTNTDNKSIINTSGNSLLTSSLMSDKKVPIIDNKMSPSSSNINKMSPQKISSVFPLKSNSEITITPNRSSSTATKPLINSTATVSPNPKPFGSQDHAIPSSSVWRNEQRVHPTSKILPPSRPTMSNNSSFLGPSKPFYHQQDNITHRNSATVAPEMKNSTPVFDSSRDYSTNNTSNYQTKSQQQQPQQQQSNYSNQYLSRNDDYSRSNTSNYNQSSSSSSSYNSQNNVQNVSLQESNRHSESQNSLQRSHSNNPVTMSHTSSHVSSVPHVAHTPSHPITTLNIPNPTMSHQTQQLKSHHTISHHRNQPSSNIPQTPQIQSLPPSNSSVQIDSKLNKKQDIRSKNTSKIQHKSKTKSDHLDPFTFQDESVNKNKTNYYDNKTSDKPTTDYNYQQYNEYYNTQQQQPYGMGYQQPSTQFTSNEKNASKKDDEKKKIEQKSSTDFPVTTSSYSGTGSASTVTTATTSASPFSSTSGGSIVATSPTSTYPDPYQATQYGSNYRYPPTSTYTSSATTGSYPNQFPTDTNNTTASSTNPTSSLYSAFHRPEPFQAIPGTDVASFLSHPFGLPSTSPHFPASSTQATPSPYYPQNVYPPSPSPYGRSPYPTPAVDPYHAYSGGFNPFLVPPTAGAHYQLPTNPPNNNDGHTTQ